MKPSLKNTMKLITHSRFTKTLPLIALTCGTLVFCMGQASAQTDQDLVEVARSVIKADRQAIVVAALELTEAEGKNFWPLYSQYRSEMDKVADGMIKLVLEYAKLYPDISEDRAKQLLKDYTNLQEKRVDRRTAFLKKFTKVLPATKALRFAQVETRLDLLVQLQLAAEVPLAPIGGGQ